MSNILVLENVSKSYKSKTRQTDILVHAGWIFEKGRMYGIFGKSGCGKTTLLKLLHGQIFCDAGRILYDAKDLKQLSVKARTALQRNQVAFLSDTPVFVDHMKIRDNILLAAKLEKETVDLAWLEQICALLEISHLLNAFPCELSAGEKQRTALARAMVLQPQVLLADEPAAHLDAAARLEIMGLLKKLQYLYQMGIVVVSHNLELVKLCDQVLQMEHGRLTPYGN